MPAPLTPVIITTNGLTRPTSKGFSSTCKCSAKTSRKACLTPAASSILSCLTRSLRAVNNCSVASTPVSAMMRAVSSSSNNSSSTRTPTKIPPILLPVLAKPPRSLDSHDDFCSASSESSDFSASSDSSACSFRGSPFQASPMRSSSSAATEAVAIASSSAKSSAFDSNSLPLGDGSGLRLNHRLNRPARGASVTASSTAGAVWSAFCRLSSASCGSPLGGGT